MDYFIGLDIGTTHCKAITVKEDGEVIRQIQKGYPTIQNFPGQSEQDPDLIFRTVVELLRISISENPGRVLKGICFSSAMHGIMAVSEDGRPLTNLFTWADLQSNGYENRISDSLQKQKLYEETGVPLHCMSPFVKLLWLKEEKNEIFEAAHKFISIKEYIFFNFFGKYLVDYSIASATGLFDLAAKDWNETALKLASISRDKLSELLPVTHKVEWNEYSKENWNDLFLLSKAAPFILGGSDGCLANLGCGAIGDGKAAITIGTSGAVRTMNNQPRPDHKRRLFNYMIEDEFFISGGAINNGGIAVKWFAENFLQHGFQTAEDFEWFFELVDSVPPGSDGVIFLPYLLGERAPHWDANTRGAFVGLSLFHGKAQMARAVIEGISFALYEVLIAVEETNGPVKVLYATGGFVQSSAWLQIIADVMNKPLVVSLTADASAIGAVLVGMKALGSIKNWKDAMELIPEGEKFEPNFSNHQIYRKCFEKYVKLYPFIKDLM